MAEPERDHGSIHTVLKQVHRGAVAQHVRCYALPFKRRTGPGCQFDMLANDALDGVAAEPITTIADEQRLAIRAAAFSEPHAERFHTVFPKRCCSLFSSLTHASHVCAGA